MTFNDKLKKGLIHTLFSQYSVVFIQIILGIILARILSPFEFGVVAVILIFLNFFNLQASSIAPGIIQYRDLSERNLNDLKIISIAGSLIITILFIIITFLVSIYFKEKEYLKIGLGLILAIIFSTLSVIPIAISRKLQKFKEIGIAVFLSTLFSGSIAIILAYNGFSYYSLVIQSSLNFILLFLSYSIISKVNILKIEKTSFNSLILTWNNVKQYTKYNSYFDLVNFSSRNLDSLLVGRYIGIESLGIYDKAYRLMLYPVSNLTQILSKVLHPVFSVYQDSRSFIRQKYLSILYLLFLGVVPLSVFFYFNSNRIIYVLYGNAWLESAKIFKILAISLPAQIFNSSTGSIFLSTGYPNYYFKSGLLNSIIIIMSIILGISSQNLSFLALALVIGYYLSSIQYYYLLFGKIFNFHVVDFFISNKNIVVYFSFSILGFLILNLFLAKFLFIEIIQLGINSVLLLLIYVFTLILTGDYKILKKVFANEKV